MQRGDYDPADRTRGNFGDKRGDQRERDVCDSEWAIRGWRDGGAGARGGRQGARGREVQARLAIWVRVHESEREAGPANRGKLQEVRRVSWEVRAVKTRAGDLRAAVRRERM